MRSLLFFLFIGLALGQMSCDPCGNLDCIGSHQFMFIFVDSTGTENLIESGVIDPSEVKFAQNLGGLEAEYSIRYIEDDYHFYGFADINIDRIFVEALGIRDTIDFQQTSYESKCCGIITEIESLQVNGVSFLIEDTNPLSIYLPR